MSRSVFAFVCFASITTALATTACSGGEIAVGKSDQQLQTRKNGDATGNGKTCSWDDTVAYDAVSGKETTTSSGNGPYVVGDNFKGLDDCNDCSCTSKGITCTTRSCGGSTPGNPGQPGCTEEAMLCPDGSSVARTGPKCEFAPCPAVTACPADAMLCPDGSTVGRTGAKCEFVCPSPKACTTDAKKCPDGSFVGRTGPNCEFAPCP